MNENDDQYLKEILKRAHSNQIRHKVFSCDASSALNQLNSECLLVYSLLCSFVNVLMYFRWKYQMPNKHPAVAAAAPTWTEYVICANKWEKQSERKRDTQTHIDMQNEWVSESCERRKKKSLWCLWIRYEASELPTSHQTINANIRIQPSLPQWIFKRCATVAFVYSVCACACVCVWLSWCKSKLWTGIWDCCCWR